ncbi:MAG: glycosyltransferase family 1 protein [Actinobacteria bacterium]|nr:MAG: glycosyltransferase family 1 protein [Actinomycetota bacterium]
MKILHTVEFYDPSVGGAQEVVKQVSERLVGRGHEVTVATSSLEERQTNEIGGVRIEPFAVSGNEVRGLSGETGRYQRFLLDGNFDVMMNYAAQQWATDLVFPLLGRLSYPAVLATCGFSGLFDPAYRDYFGLMTKVLKRYDGLIFHSDVYRDRAFARKQGVEGTLIPNGASEREFAAGEETGDRGSTFRKRHGIPEDVPMLLTVGGHSGMKGHELVLRAFELASIGPTALVIIGNRMGWRGCYVDCHLKAPRIRVLSLGRKQARLLDPPRQDVVDAYHAADLFVFGSHIECSPLVLFESMASRTPFVTVAAGNAAEIVSWSGGGVVVPTEERSDGTVTAEPRELAREIERLIGNERERSRLAEAGYAAWKERFTWEKIATQYERLYESLVSSRGVALSSESSSRSAGASTSIRAPGKDEPS